MERARAPNMTMTDHPPSPTNSLEILYAAWMSLPDADKPLFLMSLPVILRERLAALWDFFALPHQRPPALGNNGKPWTTWLILGGRGAGKTRAGAEWVRAEAANPRAHIALIGETRRDVREVMIEGVSGLLGIHPDHERPRWEALRGLV